MELDGNFADHATLRQQFVEYAEHSAGVKAGMSSLVKRVELEEMNHLEAGDKTFDGWLKSMAQNGKFVDGFVVKLAKEMCQVQLLVYTLDDTGHARNNPVEIAKRESSALCLLLEGKHYFPMILRSCWESMPLKGRPVPAIWMHTPDGQEFAVFGVTGDGNCFFRGLAFFERHFSFKLNQFNQHFEFDETVPHEVCGLAQQFWRLPMTVIRSPGQDNVTCKDGDLLNLSPQTNRTATAYMGHALLDGVRHMILFNASFTMHKLLPECVLEIAPTATADWVQNLVDDAHTKFAACLVNGAQGGATDDDPDACDKDNKDNDQHQEFKIALEIEIAKLEEAMEKASVRAARDEGFASGKLAATMSMPSAPPGETTPRRASKRLHEGSVDELKTDCKHKDEELASLREELASLREQLAAKARELQQLQASKTLVGFISSDKHHNVIEN
jgi:hypothetical protein